MVVLDSIVGAVIVSGKPEVMAPPLLLKTGGAEEIRINEVRAVRQPLLEEVDFALEGAGEVVGVAVGGNGAGAGPTVS